VLLYYLISLSGISFGRSAKLSPAVGVWMANFVFLLAGLFLLWRADRNLIEIRLPKARWNKLRDRFKSGTALRPEAISQDETSAFERAISRRRLLNAKFPLLLDDLILKDFGLYLGMILSAFILLMLVFTLFELLGDIMRNRISPIMIGDYLFNVTPSMIYLMTPLSVLLAVLVTFGLMQKANEITAMKATGISIYRVIVPILVIAAILSAGLFFFDQFYIPGANQRQETLRNTIKGKPAQTYLRPDRKWIFGEHNSIYYYELFDQDQNRFASLSMFVFDPETFQLTKRLYATRAHWEDTLHKWVFEQGWSRSFRNSAIESYNTFDVRTFGESTEPPSYFKKEVKQSQEMNYEELRVYIQDLQQSGFDVVRLRVQLHKKFAFPLITFVMAILAIPFSLSAGRRGALTSVAVAIGIAMIYWVTSGLFEAMGNTSYLPAALAAWEPDLLFALAGGYMILKVPT
jgi:LPS export ABC transporter permease LptG